MIGGLDKINIVTDLQVADLLKMDLKSCASCMLNWSIGIV